MGVANQTKSNLTPPPVPPTLRHDHQKWTYNFLSQLPPPPSSPSPSPYFTLFICFDTRHLLPFPSSALSTSLHRPRVLLTRPAHQHIYPRLFTDPFFSCYLSFTNTILFLFSSSFLSSSSLSPSSSLPSSLSLSSSVSLSSYHYQH